jgi:hypothetical protein
VKSWRITKEKLLINITTPHKLWNNVVTDIHCELEVCAAQDIRYQQSLINMIRRDSEERNNEKNYRA